MTTPAMHVDYDDVEKREAALREVSVLADNGNGGEWSRSEKLVMSELRRLSHEVREVRKELEEARMHVAALRVKAGIFGAMTGGALGGIATFAVNLLLR